MSDTNYIRLYLAKNILIRLTFEFTVLTKTTYTYLLNIYQVLASVQAFYLFLL